MLQARDWLIGLADLTGDWAEAARLAEDDLRMAEDLGLWSDVAGRQAWLAWVHVQTGDPLRALHHAEQAKRLAAELGQRSGEVFATIGLAFAARRAGWLDLAEEHLRGLLAEARDRQAGDGDPPYLSMVLVEMGLLAERAGRARRRAPLAPAGLRRVSRPGLGPRHGLGDRGHGRRGGGRRAARRGRAVARRRRGRVAGIRAAAVRLRARRAGEDHRRGRGRGARLRRPVRRRWRALAGAGAPAARRRHGHVTYLGT
ncbi:hypothetical protein ACFSTC_28525 [Nonomuraea ferruginea]